MTSVMQLTWHRAVAVCYLLCGSVLVAAEPVWAQSDPSTIFAVVTKVPRDRSRVPARVLVGTQALDSVLIVPDHIVTNPIWRALELCHSLKADAWKTPDGYRLASVRVLDPSMLPMELQGVAGDCLIRKALDVAPLVD